MNHLKNFLLFENKIEKRPGEEGEYVIRHDSAYLNFGETPEGAVFLEMVEVPEGFRHKGIASELLDKLFAYADKKNAYLDMTGFLEDGKKYLHDVVSRLQKKYQNIEYSELLEKKNKPRKIFYHASDIKNRKSIEKDGLVAKAGINWKAARRRLPKGVYLFNDRDDAIKYAYFMGYGDVWSVDVTGLHLKKDPESTADSYFEDAESFYSLDNIGKDRIVRDTVTDKEWNNARIDLDQ